MRKFSPACWPARRPNGCAATNLCSQGAFLLEPLSAVDTNGADNSIDYFVDGERAHFLLFTERLPADSIRPQQPRDFTLDIQDVPHRCPRRMRRTTQFSLRVRFYRSPYRMPHVLDSELKRWSKQLDQFAPKPGIRDATNRLTAASETAEVKARQLYEAVQTLNTRLHAREERGRAKAATPKARDEQAQDV